MTIKLLGAIFIIVGCGGFGFRIAANHLREEKTLRQLISILDFMECELQYRLTPLPDLCRQAAGQSSGVLSAVMLTLTQELEDQISPDVERCMSAALSKYKDIPEQTRQLLELFGRSLGRFDLSGQLKGIEGVRQECNRKLQQLTANKDVRLRSYQTLALCAGAALAILFI